MGSDVGERSLGVLNSGSPRAFERGNRRQREPLLPEVGSDVRERTSHLAVVSRRERKGDEAETGEADVDLVEIELESSSNRPCLLSRDSCHAAIGARSRHRFVTRPRRLGADRLPRLRRRHHAQETEQQIRNLETPFHAFAPKVDDKPCPAIEGIEK